MLLIPQMHAMLAKELVTSLLLNGMHAQGHATILRALDIHVIANYIPVTHKIFTYKGHTYTHLRVLPNISHVR